MNDADRPGPIAREVAAALKDAGIPYYSLGNGRIRISLPKEFGELEIGAIETILNSVDSISALSISPGTRTATF